MNEQSQNSINQPQTQLANEPATPSGQNMPQEAIIGQSNPPSVNIGLGVYSKKSIKKWILLICLPFISFTALVVITVIFRLIVTSPPGRSHSLASEILAPIVGLCFFVGIIGLVLIPVWGIMLVKVRKENRLSINDGGNPSQLNNNSSTTSRKNQTVAFVLAFCFGLFAWLYTYKYEEDRKKFWINFVLLVVTLGAWSLVGWIWAMIDIGSKQKEYYSFYPT